jgi:methylated-DNA-[protein]-cysteine S-methyltransferase
MTTQIAYMESPLGFIAIESDGSFINSISCNDIEANTPTNLQGLSAVLLEAIQQMEDYFAGKRTEFDLPLSQKGTDFQQSVWKGLLTIPFGKTTSYLEFSRRLGDEKAIRAVGTTNGKNKIAIVVPCHRVIGSDGSLTGYAGGLWRKKWLLEHERKVSGLQVVEQLTIF